MNSKNIANDWEVSIRFLFISILVLGFMYPLIITLLSQSLGTHLANGSLIYQDKQVIGSSLLAKKEERTDLFLYRPSANQYDTIPSSASNLGPSSMELKKQVEERKKVLISAGIRPEHCQELLYTSGSGLDPHITSECAREQGKVLSFITKIPIETIDGMIDQFVEKSYFGFIGRERVNVTKLNIAWKQFTHE